MAAPRPSPYRPLAGMPLLARLGATGFVAIALLGLWASVVQIELHHGKNDGEPGVGFDDVLGAYHGTTIPSPMRAAIDGELPGHGGVTLEEAEREALVSWLTDGRAAELFDDIDLDDMAPVEILARRCGDCHAPDGTAAPFERFSDVKPLLSDKELVSTPRDVRITSLHTHAPGMVSFGLVLALAALMTRFRPGFRTSPLALTGVGLVFDLGSWLPAQDAAVLTYAIVVGGALYAVGCVLACALLLAEVWIPEPRGNSA